MASRSLNTHKKSIFSMENIVFILLCILITYPLFLRGLYFEKELLPTLAFCFVLMIIWQISSFKNDNHSFLKTNIDLFVLMIVFMYFISIFYAVNKRMAIIEFSKCLAFFSIFILSRDLLKEDKKKNIFLNLILLGGFVVSIIGIGSAIGTWKVSGAVINNRISSTFQYPNTLASYIGALYFLCMGFLVNQDKKICKGIYGTILGTFIFTFILTYSRGMWLLFPIMFFLYFVLIPRERKLETFLYSIASAIVPIPLAFLFTRAVEGSNAKLWGYYAIATVGTGVLIYIISLIDKKLRKVSVKKLLAFLVVIVIIIALGIVYIFNATTSLTMENNTQEEKWNTVIRNIHKVLPNSHYELEFEYSAKNENEHPFAGRVIIYSVDKKGRLEELVRQVIIESDQDKLILPFDTNENTIGVKVYFQNGYPETSITFLSATILDGSSEDLDIKIPLKYKYVPESIIRRIDSIGVGENSVHSRITFYKDAFDIIKDYPIFGTGGGGWATLYQKYQSYPYWTTQAHNYFLQVWIEIGTLGLVILVGFLIFLTLYGFKKCQVSQSTEEKIMIVSLFTVIFSIFAHAFIDFDLSITAFTFVLWAIIGVFYTMIQDVEVKFLDIKKKRINKALNSKFTSIVSLLVSLTLAITSICFSVATSYAKKSGKEKNRDNLDNAISYLEKANKLDKFKPDYKIDLANMYMMKLEETGEDKYIDKAKSLADEYMKLGKYNSLVNAKGASFYMGIGLVDEGLTLIERSVELQPMLTKNYIQKCDAYLAVFNYYFFQKQDFNKANEVLQKALRVKEQMKDVNSRALKPLDYELDLIDKIGKIQFYYENLEELNNIFNQGYDLDFAYYFDLDINNDGNIDMLQIWNPEDGNAQYELVEEDSFIRITNDGENYGIVYPYGLELESDTEYLVQFKAKGIVGDDKFHFYVWDNEAENPNQGSMENIKLADDWQTYELEIKTDTDIIPGTQYLRFQHNGGDSGYIDLKEVNILKK